ncbi:23115_t:CDS:1, partial [Gigaspora rosea]
MRHISALAFLPPSEIPAVFDELKVHIPVEVHDVVQWFEDNYVHGRVRHVHRNSTLVWSELSFPPIFGLYLKILSLLTQELRMQWRAGTKDGRR